MSNDLKIGCYIFLSLLLLGCSKKDKDKISYDEMVLKDQPVGYWLLDYGTESDATKYQLDGAFKGEATTETTLPNGDKANVFGGDNSYFEIPDAAHIKLTKTGILTVEAWMRFDVLNFSHTEPGKDYIHWMGKGAPNQYSWAARMYNLKSDRPQRISGYIFNLEGGLGAGSYFQDQIPAHTWIYFVLVINTKNTSDKFPTGYTKIYKDGKLRDQDDLKSYDIVPKSSSAPIRIATRDKHGFFEGAIGKVALYDYKLTGKEIRAHFKAMK